MNSLKISLNIHIYLTTTMYKMKQY